MHVNVLKTIKTIKYHYIIAFAVLCLLFLPMVSAATEDGQRASWDQWLSNAYQLTWHDQADIDKWITEKEAMVFDQKLTDFAAQWEKRIKNTSQNSQLLIFPEKAYQHLAIAQMLLYLQTADPGYLKKALDVMNSEYLKAKLALPEMAFWYNYIKAHYDMEKGDAKSFVQDIYHIWMDVIVKFESTKYEIDSPYSVGHLNGFYRSTPYLYRNLANLILQRAIVLHRLSDIDALGIVIWNLSSRMPSKGYGKWVKQVAKDIDGPASDGFRLCFIVQSMEAGKKQVILTNLFEQEQDFPIIEKALADCLSHNEMLYGLARTSHGKIVALTKQLQLFSFIMSRLYNKGPHQVSLARLAILQREQGKAWHEKKGTLDHAIELFDNMAKLDNSQNNLFKNGFLSQQTYVNSMNELWRAIMNLSIDTAFYYEDLIDPNNAGNLQVNIPLLENTLIRYLNFFARHVDNGYQSIVPDNAFYGTVEASELLSDIYFLSAHWEKGLKKYDLALARRIQALEIFPFGVKNYYIVAQRLTELACLDRYKKYVVSMAGLIADSKVIKDCETQKDSTIGNELNNLQATVPEIILRAPFGIVLQSGLGHVPQELSQRLVSIEQEINSGSNGQDLEDKPKARIIALTHELKNRLVAKERFTRDELLAIIADVDPLVALIQKSLPSRSQTELDDNPPFERDLGQGSLNQLALELKQIKEECILLSQLPDMRDLQNKMVIDVNHPFHRLLRQWYFENYQQKFNYIKLLTEINHHRS